MDCEAGKSLQEQLSEQIRKQELTDGKVDRNYDADVKILSWLKVAIVGMYLNIAATIIDIWTR